MNILNAIARLRDDIKTWVTYNINILNTKIDNKLDAGTLPGAINEALTQAKESGELKGEKGEDGISATHSWSGTTLTIASASGTSSADLKGEQGIQGIQGEQGIKGDKGDPFSISKVYTSVSAMNAGFATDNVSEGGFVVIETGNVNDADNAKLYIKGTTKYEFLTNLSGAQGIQGPQGVQGVQGEKGRDGAKGDKGADGYSPVRGTDYWTDTDKAEIQAYINSAIATALANLQIAEEAEF